MEEEKKEKEVIILNKPFKGGWLNNEGNIGHEIIDFFLADNGKHYVYNMPHGQCPSNFLVGDEEKKGELKKTKGKYIAEYMVLVNDVHTKKNSEKKYEILYIIKLKGKIRHSCEKTNEEIIKSKEIKYNKILLNDIYGPDGSQYLTFEAEAIYKVSKPSEPVIFNAKKFNFGRNTNGYIKSDVGEYSEDYNELREIIKNNEIVSNKSNLKKLAEESAGKFHIEKTFLDLIGAQNSEQAFTNMLHSLLNNNEIFKKFCREFKKREDEFAEKETFTIKREYEISNKSGRIDICGESESQIIIIENKIDSALNGKKKDEKITQLTTYYNWGMGKNKKLICFITVPDYRFDEIENEIKDYDNNMVEKYKIIKYSEIVKFLNENEELLKKNELIKKLYKQIRNAFANWSYPTKEKLYASMFLMATIEAKRKYKKKNI